MTVIGGNKTAFNISFLGILLSFFLILLFRNDIYLMTCAGPVILFIILFFALSEIKPVFYLLILCLPFSVPVNLPGTSVQMILPGEGIEAILFIVYLLRYFTGKQKFDTSFFLHPVTLAVLLFLGFSMISLVFSSMPVVSEKAVAVKLVYIGVYYFFLHEIIKDSPASSVSAFTYYGFAAMFVVFYSLYNHAAYHFSKDSSGIVAMPFFADHTIYSACLALVLPVFLMLLFDKNQFRGGLYFKCYYFFTTLILITGIFFSMCRATWLSLVTSLFLFLLIRFKVRPAQIFLGLLLVGILVYINNEQIIGSFKQNRYDSNAKGAGLEEQTKSITNISNDQSNGERLNRWNCALRMFIARPWFGFGPGTYQFQYFPFQKFQDMTRISVTNPYNISKGHGGTAHSEYLLVLSESGIFAFISFLSVIIMTLSKAIKTAIFATDKRLKNITITFMIGLATYLTHGLFNNFLDTDKAAFLFWGAISILTTTDIQLKKNRQKLQSHEN